MKAAQRLYLTADRDALVGEGDPAGAFLYAAPGDEIPDSAVERFGLVEGRLTDTPVIDAAAAAAAMLQAWSGAADNPVAAGSNPPAKEAAPGEDKDAKPGADKDGAGNKTKGD